MAAKRSSGEWLSPPRMVLCAGLKSSGSTWLYNATIGLLLGHRLHGYAPAIVPFYADRLADFPREASGEGALIVKTHCPSDAMEFLARQARAKVLISIREPRDAIASLMQRFGHRYDDCLNEIAVNAARVVDLAQEGEALVLRYEKGFVDRLGTIEEVARYLDVKLSKSRAQGIFRSLTASSVRNRIARVSAGGGFGKRPNPDRFEPETHWHPGHVGDRRIGKFESVLTQKMQLEVLAATRDYCGVFHYSTHIKIRPDRRKPRGNRQHPRVAGRIPIV